MTELDTESIWKATLDTTRFGKIGVRIAEILNFKIMQDATSQITNTAVLPILEQLSEEALFRLIAASKTVGVPNPWDFILSNVIDFMSTILRQNKEIIDDIKKILNRSKSIEIVTGVKL